MRKNDEQFNLNSDIHFFVELVDMTLKEKKIIKKKEISKIKILYDVIKEETEKPKRTNSMTLLRPHSQTIDSKTTRDSSIKNSILIKQSSEKNINKIKEKNNKTEKEIEKIEETNNFKNLTEEKKDNDNIKIDENIQKNNMKFDDFLNKLINDNYFNDNISLIYHFCQQCFCFLDVETIFNQILDTYENIRKNIIDNSDEKLNNLIEFTNALFVEMIYYYYGDNIIYDYILIPINFYYKLIPDLIINLNITNKKEENNIQPFQLDLNEKDNENNIIDDTNDIYEYIDENNTINDNNENNTIKDINSNEDNYIINKNTLINMNMNMNINIEKKIEKIIVQKEEDLMKKSKSSSIKLRSSATLLFKGSIKDKEEFNEETKEKTRKVTKYLSSNKRKIEMEIKEEEDDEEKEESNILMKRNTINILSNNKGNKEKEVENKKNDIIEDIMKKGQISKMILSSKEEQLKNMKNIMNIFDKIKEKESLDKYLKEAKNDLKLYKDIKNKKEKEKEDLIIYRHKQKRLTKNYTSLYFFNNSLIKKKENREYLNKGYFCITDWKTEEIGNQLMIITKSLLNKINPRELYRAKFLKKEKDNTSPNVINCIKRFNNLTSFIMEDILSYNTPKERAKIYEKWVSIAEYCRINKDYSDLIAIYSAFNHYIITGLNLTLKEVKAKTNTILNKIKNFCSVEGNYLKIRKEIDNCIKNRETFIPYLGMLLRDINFFEEKSKYINEKGIINFEKIEKISEMFEVFFKFKEKEENKNNVINIKELEFFNDLEDITEEELENIADNIEPEYKLEESKKLKKRLTKIDKKYFEKYKVKENEEPEDLDTAFIK